MRCGFVRKYGSNRWQAGLPNKYIHSNFISLCHMLAQLNSTHSYARLLSLHISHKSGFSCVYCIVSTYLVLLPHFSWNISLSGLFNETFDSDRRNIINRSGSNNNNNNSNGSNTAVLTARNIQPRSSSSSSSCCCSLQLHTCMNLN